MGNDEQAGVWRYGAFVEGATVFRWSDGARFQIVNNREQGQTRNGYTDSLYRVRQGGRVTEVWGGELANAALTLGNQLFLARVVGTGSGRLRQVEARLAPRGSVLRFAPIEVQESDRFGYSLAVTATPARGLAGVERLLFLRFTYEACDYPNGVVVLLQQGSRLIYGLRALESANEVATTATRLIFPSEPGGQPGNILRLQTIEERSDDGFRVLRRRTTTRVFHWKGGRVVPAPPGAPE